MLLDEIGETSSALQVKLLRTLEESEVRPVGASRTVKIDVRVVAATNVELERAVADGQVPAGSVLPAERRRDPGAAAARSAGRHSPAHRGVPPQRVPPRRDASAVSRTLRLTCWCSHAWPGNVRELENTIERVVLFSPGTTVDVGDLPAGLGGRRARRRGAPLRRPSPAGRGRAPLSAPRARAREGQPDARRRGPGHRPADALPDGGAIRARLDRRGNSER